MPLKLDTIVDVLGNARSLTEKDVAMAGHSAGVATRSWRLFSKLGWAKQGKRNRREFTEEASIPRLQARIIRNVIPDVHTVSLAFLYRALNAVVFARFYKKKLPSIREIRRNSKLYYNIYPAMKILEERGLVRKIPKGQKKLVEITPEGKELYELMVDLFSQISSVEGQNL